MTALLTRKYGTRFLPAGLAVAALVSGCSKEETAAPTPMAPSQYVLHDVHYFFAPGDRVDTTLVDLPKRRVQNPHDTLLTQQVESGFGELVKTSQFELTPTTRLPQEVDMSQFHLPVPQNWYGQQHFDYSVASFPFTTTQHQQPYGFAAARTLPVWVPAKSQLVISCQIEAYEGVCSFQGVVENTTTGQRYLLQGKWKGVLGYNHPSVTLTQLPL